MEIRRLFAILSLLAIVTLGISIVIAQDETVTPLQVTGTWVPSPTPTPMPITSTPVPRSVPITLGEPFAGVLTADVPNRYHTFSAEANDVIAARIVTQAHVNPRMDVFGEGNAYVSGSVNRGTSALSQHWMIPSTGTYGVMLHLNNPDPTNDYELTVRNVQRNPITLNTRINGTLTDDLFIRRYSFELDVATMVTMVASSTDFSPYIRIMSDTPEPLDIATSWIADTCASDSTIHAGICTQGDMLLEPGRYSLLVHSMDDSVGDFLLQVTPQDAPRLKPGTPITLELIADQTAAYTYFFNTDPGLYDIRVEALDMVDTRLELRMQGGLMRASDDDSGVSVNPEIVRYRLDDPGPFVIVVQPQFPDQGGRVMVTVDRNQESQLDAGPRIGSVDGAADLLFSFEAEAGQTLQASVTLREGAMMPGIAVEDGTSQLAFLPQSVVQSIDLEFSVNVTGTHFVRLYRLHPEQVSVVEVAITAPD